MEEQAKDRKEQEHRDVAFDPKYIPKLVDGSGDTPGAKPQNTDRSNLGFGSACVGSIAFCRGHSSSRRVDCRPHHRRPTASGQQILENTKLLPEASNRVAVMDAEGGQLSDEIAAALWEKGWTLARQLAGGWAEWIEHAEPDEKPPQIASARYQVGSHVETKAGEKGVVQAVRVKGRGHSYDILVDYDSDGVLLGIAESKLKA